MVDDQTDLPIVGGGSAGMMAGLLFARAGLCTLGLEKHGDFLRFRGERINRVIRRFEPEAPLRPRLLSRHGWLRRIPAALLGFGIRPEHIRSPGAGLRSDD